MRQQLLVWATACIAQLVFAVNHPASPFYLSFSGRGQYVEIPNAPDLSFGPGGLTVSAWIRPDTLEFTDTEGSGYVWWMGKGEPGRYEWALRMYSRTNKETPPRPNRISFYLFNLEGGLGEGSYFQQPVRAREWIHVTAVASRGDTAIYRNGEYVRCDEYDGPSGHGCQAHSERIHPMSGNAPLRLATRDLKSFFEGGLSQVRIWNRALTANEIRRLYRSNVVPRAGLAADFPLNEGQGRVVHDTTGRHEGTIVAAKWATLDRLSVQGP